MGSPKPQASPFNSQTANQGSGYNRTENRYGIGPSVANTAEGQAYLNTPLDYGAEYAPTNISVDPGVGRRTDLAEQDVENAANSAFNFGGVPAYIRNNYLQSQRRQVRAQGAAEAQQAEYQNQIGNEANRQFAAQYNSGIRGQRTNADLARRQSLLPGVVNTFSGTDTYNTGNQNATGAQTMFPQGSGLLNSLIGAGATIGSAFI
jgi:hypothetical protein